MEKTIRENKKYKLTKEVVDEGYVQTRTFVNGRQFATICADIWYFLYERYWFFGYHWRKIGWATPDQAAEKWLTKYFGEQK